MNLLLPSHQHEALPPATHYGKARIVTLRKAVDELRQACRQEGTPRIQDAIDRAEPWIAAIFTTGGE
jgi:hypothetical protein